MADETLENELMPNSSEAQGVYVPDPDDDQEEEGRDEDNKMALAEPLIEELLEWFDEQIAACDSIEQAKITAKAYNGKAAPINDALVAHDIVRGLLESQKAEIEARYSAYKEKQKDKSNV